jgi:hypothetical protein
MRGAAIMLALALTLMGCSREADFDERYAEANKAIGSKAAEIDAELAERERQANEAAAQPSASPAPQATSLMKAAK